MKKSEPDNVLRQLILEKEAEHRSEGKFLKDQFHLTYESLKPVNIIKNTLKEVVTSPDIRTNATNAAIGLATGFIAKKIFTGGSDNPMTKFAGVILEMVIARKVANNVGEIKIIADIILRKIIDHHRDRKQAC